MVIVAVAMWQTKRLVFNTALQTLQYNRHQSTVLQNYKHTVQCCKHTGTDSVSGLLSGKNEVGFNLWTTMPHVRPLDALQY
jgi:hypothetical protein